MKIGRFIRLEIDRVRHTIEASARTNPLRW
jgi:hypothetical protein